MNDIKINLELTLDEVNALLVALQELPAKVCNPITAKIREQGEAQLPKQEEVPAPTIQE